jgi:hypothetical protein
LALALAFTTLPQSLWAEQDPNAPQGAPAQAAPDQNAPDQTTSQSATIQSPPAPGQAAPPYTQQTAEQLQQLVAPIALYPDSLVAQILAASTFPEQVVEADRWVQAHPDLKGTDLGNAVDQQPWDPSVKALTGFPSVLGNMDKNLSWTSSLGDAYYNQQQEVMDAVQVMRRKAQDAGNLKDTPQQTVTEKDAAIDIEPVDPEVVYVPAYDPWGVYGYPVVAWPGWYPYPGIWFGGPYLSFGVGFGIGWYGGFGWGWGHWGVDWHLSTAAELGPGLLGETARPRGDTPPRTVRVACDRALSVATVTEETPEVFRRGEAPASGAAFTVAEAEEVTVVVADGDDRGHPAVLMVCETSKWRLGICGERSGISENFIRRISLR